MSKPALPKSTNATVLQLKVVAKRVKIELDRGYYQNEYAINKLRLCYIRIVNELQVTRQLESEYSETALITTTIGRKKHNLNLYNTPRYKQARNHLSLSRRYMRKKYRIDSGITIAKGDVYFNRDTKTHINIDGFGYSENLGEWLVTAHQLDTTEDYIKTFVVLNPKQLKCPYDGYSLCGVEWRHLT